MVVTFDKMQKKKRYIRGTFNLNILLILFVFQSFSLLWLKKCFTQNEFSTRQPLLLVKTYKVKSDSKTLQSIEKKFWIAK